MRLHLKGEITEDGQLKVELPPGFPAGKVEVFIRQNHVSEFVANMPPKWKEEEIRTLRKPTSNTDTESIIEVKDSELWAEEQHTETVYMSFKWYFRPDDLLKGRFISFLDTAQLLGCEIWNNWWAEPIERPYWLLVIEANSQENCYKLFEVFDRLIFTNIQIIGETEFEVASRRNNELPMPSLQRYKEVYTETFYKNMEALLMLAFKFQQTS